MKKTALLPAEAGNRAWNCKTAWDRRFFRGYYAASPEEKYAGILEQLKTENIDYLYVQGDISDHGDRMRCIDRAIEKYGRIDVLVNNAGVAPKQRADILEMTRKAMICNEHKYEG